MKSARPLGIAVLSSALLFALVWSSRPPEDAPRKPEHTFEITASGPMGRDEAPAELYVPGGASSLSEELESMRQVAAVSPCPTDMVLVLDRYCVDRYEARFAYGPEGATWSPHFPPSIFHARLTRDRFSDEEARADKSGHRVPFPPLLEQNLAEAPAFEAVSAPGHLPQGYLRLPWAKSACEASGKRLCTEHEWVRACRGERNQNFPYGDNYREGACNIHRHSHPAVLLFGSASKNHLDPRLNLAGDEDGPLLRPTGSTKSCQSEWNGDAIYDMVGNIDEWIDDPQGTFVGGFYSRGTKAGCLARIDVHDAEYFDYSLGVRCCKDRSD